MCGKLLDKSAVICDLSAWAYWSTPPIVRDTDIPLSVATSLEGLGMPPRMFSLRRDSSEPEARIRGRLLGDLKGIPLPISVLVGPDAGRRRTRTVAPRKMRIDLSDDDLVDLGAGLYVTSPEATLRHLARRLELGALLMRMYEACGLYAICPGTARARYVVRELVSGGLLDRDVVRSWEHFPAYSEPSGSRVAYADDAPWAPCFKRNGSITDLWKRPPLTRGEALLESIERVAAPKGVRGLALARRAAEQVLDGSGSPLESRCAILMFTARELGGEDWPRPHLNRIIELDESGRNLSGQRSCVADALLPSLNAIIEVNGEEYHADEWGFAERSGRLHALEGMGYTVFEVIDDHLRDLDKLDDMMGACAMKLGLPFRPRLSDFVVERDALHRQIFS